MELHAGKTMTFGRYKKKTNKPQSVREVMKENFKFGGGRDGGDHLTSNSP